MNDYFNKVQLERDYVIKLIRKSFENKDKSKNSLFTEQVSCNEVDCPLEPNGNWAHIPLDWLKMMGDILDLITQAIRKDEIQLIYDLDQNNNKTIFKDLLFHVFHIESLDEVELTGTPDAIFMSEESESDSSMILFHSKRTQSVSPKNVVFNRHQHRLSVNGRRSSVDYAMNYDDISLIYHSKIETPLIKLIEVMHTLPVTNVRHKNNLHSISLQPLFDNKSVKERHLEFLHLLKSNLVYAQMDYVDDNDTKCVSTGISSSTKTSSTTDTHKITTIADVKTISYDSSDTVTLE